MSNGSPPQLADGRVKKPELARLALRLTAYAEGCSVADELDNWWPIHNAIDGGNDFTRTISLKKVIDALDRSEQKIVILSSKRKQTVFADVEWRTLTA